MNRQYLYQNTPSGHCAWPKPDQKGPQSLVFNPLLGVVSRQPGEFEIKATGDKPSVGSDLFVPVKGSRQISLRLVVRSIEDLITPAFSWSAVCEGMAQEQFLLRSLDAQCDHCGTKMTLEFLQVSDDLSQDAIRGLNDYGWHATSSAQICEGCHGAN